MLRISGIESLRFVKNGRHCCGSQPGSILKSRNRAQGAGNLERSSTTRAKLMGDHGDHQERSCTTVVSEIVLRPCWKAACDEGKLGGNLPVR